MRPFHTAINIAVLLQSLDSDGNPENGIEIKQGVAALFNRVNLNLEQHWDTFQNESTLRHALGKASRERPFSKAHGIVKPAGALEHLYQTLGVDPRAVGITLLNIAGRDGNPTRYERFQYDAVGKLAWHDDNTLDAFESWQYDPNNNMTSRKVVYSDGTVDEIGAWEYDANGTLARAGAHKYREGVIEEATTFQYNVTGWGHLFSMLRYFPKMIGPIVVWTSGVRRWQHAFVSKNRLIL